MKPSDRDKNLPELSSSRQFGDLDIGNVAAGAIVSLSSFTAFAGSVRLTRAAPDRHVPPSPQPGDVVVRNNADLRFDIVDFEGHLVDGPFETPTTAFARARIEAGAGAIWHQPFDLRGRALSLPGVITPRPTLGTGT